ncbi:Clp protease N-terminal domain-containing protein [Arthrobacter sp. AOP36-A1-22]|uniref:Clp protease N-terminal domain-containing protein n=1 Tax=unclassified Arthrobacter TaxID=235627 RepID=UPI00265BF1D7|nr:Clp protease N-terminal domain-containing protein [Nocardioides sp.]
MSARTMPIYLTAAWREAARAREPYIDLDHLLIGLIAAGGQAAQLLTRHGIDLISARSAAGAVHADAVALLGVDVRALPAPAPRPLNELNRGDVGEVPMNERADRLIDRLGVRATERDLLHALLAEPSGTIRDLIERGGADLETMTSEVVGGHADWSPVAPQRAQTVESQAETRMAAVQLTHFIPAERGLVRSVATDSTVAPQWLMVPDTTRQNDGTLVVDVTKRGRTRTLRLTPTADEDGHVRWDDQPLGWYELRFVAVDGGTILTLTRAVRPLGLLGAALIPLIRLSNGLGLLVRAQNLALACADAMDHK